MSTSSVLVVGATGGTGRATLSALLERGHTPTAFVRSPHKLGSLRDRVRVVEGDVLDAESGRAAVAGHEAVVVSLGVHPNPLRIRTGWDVSTPLDICSRGTAVVLDAMEAEGVRRVVAVSSFGVGDSWADVPLGPRLFMRLFLMDAFADKARQEAMLARADATILRPVHLTGGPATGTVLVSADGEARSGSVSRADVAAVAVDALETPGTIGQTLTLSA